MPREQRSIDAEDIPLASSKTHVVCIASCLKFSEKQFGPDHAPMPRARAYALPRRSRPIGSLSGGVSLTDAIAPQL